LANSELGTKKTQAKKLAENATDAEKQMLEELGYSSEEILEHLKGSTIKDYEFIRELYQAIADFSNENLTLNEEEIR
jgi:hypothetical protein